MEAEAHQVAGCGFDHLYLSPRLQPWNALDTISQTVFNEHLKHLQISPAVCLCWGSAISTQLADLDLAHSQAIIVWRITAPQVFTLPPKVKVWVFTVNGQSGFIFRSILSNFSWMIVMQLKCISGERCPIVSSLCTVAYSLQNSFLSVMNSQRDSLITRSCYHSISNNRD